MLEVKETEASLFDLFRWDILQNVSILHEDKTTLQDAEFMLKVYSDILEERLNWIVEPSKKIESIDEQIEKTANRLFSRQYLILLLDGQAKEFQNTIQEKIQLMAMEGSPASKHILNLHNYLLSETAIKARFEFDPIKKRAMLLIGKADNSKKIDWIGIAKAYIGLRFALGKEEVELPKELHNFFGISKSSLFFTALFNRKKIFSILFRPLIMLQVKRMYLECLKQRKMELIGNLSQKEVQLLGQNQSNQSTDWHKLIGENPIDTREIKISFVYLSYIAEKLKPYFSDDDFQLLLLILEGKSIKPKRIIFGESGSMLGYFFRELKDKEGIIDSKKAEIERWMADYIDFQNQQSKNITPFMPEMAHQYVSSKVTLKGKNTIDISDLENFKQKIT